jgi:sigma-B regulation protein RsbU (phosphoserine phosphatase)
MALLAAVSNAAPAIDGDAVAVLGERLEQARLLAAARQPELPFQQSEAFAAFIAAPEFQKLQGQLRAMDLAPPHFGDRQTPGGAYEYRPGPDEYEKDVYVMLHAEQPGVGLVLADVSIDDVGTTYPMDAVPEMMMGWDGPAAEQHITADEYGRTLGAWAPVRNSAGEVVAILGMDAPAAPIEGILHDIHRLVITIFLVAVGLSGIPAVLLSHRLHRPVRLLTEGMSKLGCGECDAHVPPQRTGDEFEALIDTFNNMVDALRERDALRHSLAVATEIQQHLLPMKTPAVEGFDICGGIDYCDETGGDYYDYIDLLAVDRHHMAIAIGDVTGHGIGAALLMASGRAVLRSHAAHHGVDIPRLFADVNNQLVQDTGDERFMTLFYGMLDAERRELTYASAGHDPVLWYRHAQQSVESLGNTGIPLGIMNDWSYTQAGPLALGDQDVLVLTTDGIREAKNADGEEFGSGRLSEIITSRATESADGIYAAIVQAVRDWQGPAAQEDDITLVVIKTRPRDD